MLLQQQPTTLQHSHAPVAAQQQPGCLPWSSGHRAAPLQQHQQQQQYQQQQLLQQQQSQQQQQPARALLGQLSSLSPRIARSLGFVPLPQHAASHGQQPQEQLASGAYLGGPDTHMQPCDPSDEQQPQQHGQRKHQPNQQPVLPTAGQEQGSWQQALQILLLRRQEQQQQQQQPALAQQHQQQAAQRQASSLPAGLLTYFDLQWEPSSRKGSEHVLQATIPIGRLKDWMESEKLRGHCDFTLEDTTPPRTVRRLIVTAQSV
jgi:hypothetical protein